MSHPHSEPVDFDFIIGDWHVRDRRLKERLTGCTEWVEFDGTSSTKKVLGGLGNVEDNLLLVPEGSCRAVALRSFCSLSEQWSIWWLDGRYPMQLDPPLVGSFVNGIGLFYVDDTLNGKPIKVRFTWLASESSGPRWEQAFSDNAGKTWETNWTMVFTRAAA